ncbi:uncharacterized protein [Euphorbia lathyris]|uniref:uncharacterized protein n=1 Tax=Euphorbia lathyris TaxID=212925 RepID=UPI0033144157
MDSCQLQSMDEEIRFRMKHQRLLEEFVDLQKDFVSKKKKMQITQKKRDALLAEVRFLRQKHSYLMDLRSNKLEAKKEPVSPEKSCMQNENVDKKEKIKDRETINKRIKNL